MSEGLRARRLRAQTVLVSAATGLVVATTALALLFFARPLVLARWGRSATDWLGGVLLAVQVLSSAAGWWAATELGTEPPPPQPSAAPAPPAEAPAPVAQPPQVGPAGEARGVCPAPVVPLAARIVAIPLVGPLDPERLLAVQGDVLHETERRRARVALVDLAGAGEMPPQGVEAFERLVRAVRLLGCQVVVTGVHGQVAHALLEAGVDDQLETRRDLRAGLRYALRLTRSQAPCNAETAEESS
ncbi:MAG: STAS domain-containing protein [Anaerolineae bacterium]|nr:STAS domain-containing protein [Anaerolineae bacterium]